MAAKIVATPGPAASGILKRQEKMLDTIRLGTEKEAIALFSEEAYDVNTGVNYTFDDRKKYVVTPLAWAVRYKKPLLCRYLLNNGADPYSNLVFDYYPLHEACNRGFDDIVKIFISTKCDINGVTSDHHSPLHIACMRGNIECARLLLEAGANRQVKNNNGHTPLELGIYHGQTDLYKLFSYYSDDSKPKIQRRHSLHSPTGEPRQLIKQIVSMDSSFEFRPQSMLLDFQGISTSRNESTATEDVGLQIPNGNIDRTRSLSNQNLSYGFTAQPHTCSGSVAPTNSQLLVAHAQMNSGLSPSSARPTLIKQFSQASPCAADSPSPVERDGVLPHSSSYKICSSQASVEVTMATEVVADAAELFSACDRSKAAPKKTRKVLKDKHYLDASLHSSVSFQGKLAPNHSHSNPEFPLLTQISMKQTERTHSYDDLYSKCKRPPFHSQAEESEVSPSREKINSLSSQIYSSLDQNGALALSSYATGPYQHILKDEVCTNGSESNPMCEVMQRIINVTTPLLNLNQAHIETLKHLSSACNQTTVHRPVSCCAVSSAEHVGDHVYDSPATHLLSLRYKLIDKPLTVAFGVPCDGYMTLTFELVDLNRQRKDALLKVVTKIFDLKNKCQSSTYHYSMDEGSFPSSLYADASSSNLLEISLLTQLSQNPHPNITEMITSFKANTSEQHELFAQQMNPDNPKKIYTTARIANFMILRSPKVNLREHLESLRKSSKPLRSDVFPEMMVLSLLSQVLLAVGHLVHNQIAHCAVSLCNVFIDESDSNRVVLANFSHAVQLNPHKQNLERIRQTHSRLKAGIEKNPRRGQLSPEVVEAIENSELENTFFAQGELRNLFAKSDTYSVAWMIYSWFLSSSHSFIHQDRTEPYTYNDIPYLSEFSPHLNHLLRKLLAYDCKERLSPMEGVMACFVLIFGPNVSNISTEEECYKWLLAETVELYMRPVLVDSKVKDYTDSFSKLLCVYLTVACSNPRGVWDACKFFSKC